MLAAIAVASRHAARLAVLRGGDAPRTSLVHRRRAGLVAMAELLDATTPSERLDLGQALGEYAHRHPEGGAALVLSDFLLEPAALEPGVAALRRRGYAVYLLQRPRPQRDRARAGARERRAGGRRVRRATRPWRSTPRSSRATARCSRPTRTRCARSPCASGATWASFASDTPVLEIATRDLVRIDLVRARR